ncbi:Gfo/Idh/MocA family oxidoreductase [Paenibacillus sp. LHD-38]|uniref:Gfo/Idh/MocA family protein n=1 Tax=Paenibacillus sp. LHD-38 TaxID=3072143 RepID=UPI00280DC9F9|nr:Gfo/Idh/MocA family oxidoreductase [Paenibacillus sp. LHD-38]MDQ8736789.1 Gfo/Idh/MocA family oxidoreductase [Paenibacillus sp. LHD-38]
MIRIYIIGAGVIGRYHAEAVRKLSVEEPVLLKVADPNQQTLSVFQEAFPEAEAYADAGVMLSEAAKEDDIVIIGTPPFTHFELSRMALKSGRHVLCEKPLVMNGKEAEELLELAKRQNRMLGCCSDRFLGLSKTEEVKQLLLSQTLGNLYKVTFVYRNQRSRAGVEYQPESKWFLDRVKSGGGILMDWGPYDFTVLNDLLNPEAIEVVAAWTSQPVTEIDPADITYDVEGHVGAMLQYCLPEGKKVWVQYERASCTHGEPYHHVELEGTMGAVKWSPYFETDEVVFKQDKEGQVNTQESLIAHNSPYTVMDHPIYYFYRKVRGLDSRATINEQAVFNLQCLQAIYDCAETGLSQTVSMLSRNELVSFPCK